MSHLRLKSFRSHEVVREQNKREQRKFDVTTDGRVNEFKFKLNGINAQQRIVEKELERIRAGVHKPPNSAIAEHHKTLSPPALHHEKKLHHRTDKKSPKRSPKPQRKSEHVEIDTNMIVDYLQKLKDADVINLDNLITDKPIKGLEPVTQKMNSDPEMYQRSDQQPERSGNYKTKHKTLSNIDDVNTIRRGSADTCKDLIHKTSSQNQRHLKSSPIAAMNVQESERVSEKDEIKEVSDANAKFTDKSKINGDQKKPKPEEMNNQVVFDYGNFGFANVNSMKMMNSDKQWEQARKARYVRTREPLERDKELSVKEIFDQSS